MIGFSSLYSAAAVAVNFRAYVRSSWPPNKEGLVVTTWILVLLRIAFLRGEPIFSEITIYNSIFLGNRPTDLYWVFGQFREKILKLRNQNPCSDNHTFSFWGQLELTYAFEATMLNALQQTRKC